MLHDDEITIRQIRGPTDPAIFSRRIEYALGTRRDFRRDINRGTAGDMHVGWIFTELLDALTGEIGRDKMKVGELGDRMPYLFVDRAGHLAALDVHKRDVHVRRGDGRRERLVP